MWGHFTEEGQIGVRICRFMVDKAHQNKGIGRKALQIAIEEITQTDNLKILNVSYWPRNTISKRLYASFGFIEVGVDEHGEMVAEIKVDEL